MIPDPIIDYLKRNRVAFVLRQHSRAVDGQRLAAALHVSGHRVAKSVIVRADGKRWLVVLPVTELVDELKLARALGAREIELVPESEFEGIFEGCELGAEPPFGALYGVPVFVDVGLTRCKDVVFRAGSHEESVEMSYQDFARLERPATGECARPPIPRERWREERPEARP